MKLIFSFLTCLLFSIFSSAMYAQVIWFEDFESYADGTGYTGSSEPPAALFSGDYPSGVSKWTLDTLNAQLTSSTDWISVQSDDAGNKVFELRDTDGMFAWSSEIIDISQYLDVLISVSISETSNLESTDYINIYYKMDGGVEVLFETNGSNYDDFTSAVALQDSLIGDSLQIVIRAKNNAGLEYIRFDDVYVLEKSLIFTEVVSSELNSSTAYVELKNGSNHTLNFDSTDYYLSVQTDGGLWNDLKLEGSLCSGCVVLYAQDSTSFKSVYNFYPPEATSSISGNGNDAYFIYYNGNHTSGSIVDAYGVVDENGIGKPWFYEGSRAVRNSEVVVASPSWSSSEWSILSLSSTNSSPGALENELRHYNSMWYPTTHAPSLFSTEFSVVVQADSAYISEDINCTHLSVLDYGSLVVSPGVGITASGILLNKGFFKLRSNSTSSSSIIVHQSSSGTLFYDRFLTGGTLNSWHLVSAPLKGQNIYNFLARTENNILSSVTNNFALAPYNSTTEMWNYFHNGFGQSPNVAAIGSGNFLDATGYAILRDSDGVVEFSGTLISNDVTTALIAEKWNLIGNPYPSFMNANSLSGVSNLLNANIAALQDSHQAIYIWNNSSNQYEIVNNASPATFLSPGQGFFILTNTDVGFCNFSESMQSHQSDDWFERIIDYPSIVIRAKGIDRRSSTELKFVENSSFGFDIGYDAGRFSAIENDFYMFSHLADMSNQELALGLQCIPFENSVELTAIPLGFVVGNQTEVRLSFELNQIPNTSSVYLKDVLLDSTVVVSSQTNYNFSINESESLSGRFFMLIHQDSLNIEADEVEQGKASVYVESNYLYISEPEDVKNIKIYDVLGNLLVYEPMSKPFFNLSFLTKGVYIVKVKYYTKEVTLKFIF